MCITPREAEILNLIAGGLADKEIARRLGISSRTVRTHLERLFKRLDVHSRAQALACHRHRGGEELSDRGFTRLSGICQVTLPVKVVQQLGLAPGDELRVETDGNRIVLSRYGGSLTRLT